MKQRSSQIIMSDAAKVLRDLRLRSNISMKEAGKRIGVTDSYISHIENGRTNVPVGPSLLAILDAYGGVSMKYYQELIRLKRKEVGDIDIITDLVSRMNPHQLKTARLLIEQLCQVR
jgi:transcriptional regulator with XRE-family HTH domain